MDNPFAIEGTSLRNKKLILGGFTCLMVIHLACTFSGFYGSDDINYSRYAADVANHGASSIPVTDHFQLRWAIIYSTAFFYRLFGINAFTSSLFSAICLAICGAILYKILRNKKTGFYLFAMTIFFFGHSIIFYMHRLLPDAAVCLAVLWMYYTCRPSLRQSKYPLLYGVNFALALIFAVICKETIIIALPLFAVLFVRDLFKNRHLRFWLYAVAFSILFIFIYLFYFKITTNDYFFRYHLLLSKSYLNICSFDLLPFSNTLNRVGYQLWQAMLLNGDFLVFLPALAGAFYHKKILYTGIRRIDIFSFFFLLCCANFMTISVTAYVPLCHDPRHFIFLMPFAAITGGAMVYAFFKAPAKFIWLPLLFIAATIIMFVLHAGTTKYLYLLFALLFTGYYLVSLISQRKLLYTVSAILFIVLFSCNYLIDFVKPPFPYYWDHKQVIEKAFNGKNNDTATVFSADAFSAELSEYFLNFKTGNLRFLPMDSIKKNNQGQLYYLLNRDLNKNESLNMDSLLTVNTGKQVKVAEREKKVVLYKVDNSFLQVLKQEQPK